MKKKVELAWDCPYCSTKKIKGRFRECPNCGRPRSEDTKFYLPKGNGIIGQRIGTKWGHNIVDASSLKSTKPDWYCNSCDSYNSDSEMLCTSCGAPRDKDTKNYAEINQDKPDLSESARAAIREEFRKETKKEEQHTNKPTFKEKLKNWVGENSDGLKKGGVITASAILIAIVIIGLIFLFSQKITITVQEMHWEYSVDVEIYKKFRENGWSVPKGGIVDYTKQEIHHYDKVLDHYETVYVDKSETYIDHYETVAVQKSETYIDHYDIEYEYMGDDGNGYGSVREVRVPVYETRYYTDYEQRPVYKTRYWKEPKQEPVYRQDPVYRTKYYYDIWRWVFDRTVSNQGQVSELPQFPNPTLSERERLGAKHTKYWIIAVVNDTNAIKTYKTTQEIWEQINVLDELVVGKYASSISEIKKRGE